MEMDADCVGDLYLSSKSYWMNANVLVPTEEKSHELVLLFFPLSNVIGVTVIFFF